MKSVLKSDSDAGIKRSASSHLLGLLVCMNTRSRCLDQSSGRDMMMMMMMMMISHVIISHDSYSDREIDCEQPPI